MRPRGEIKAGNGSLRVEPGECVVVSPASERFGGHYRRAQPRTAKEARDLLGVSEEMADALRECGACSEEITELVRVPSPDELTSEDEVVRGQAFETAGLGLRDFLLSPSPARMAQMVPVIDRYLELTGLALNVVSLRDIHVADGATLEISDDTHVLEANDIVIEGSGTIKSSGFLKLSVNSVQGV
jgi:hypothetical protein